MAIRIALAGNPNCGKTTLFNELTGSSQYVGNWPGVTVEKKDGILKGHKDVIIQDLPGIYSLSPYTMEEKVARNYLVNEQPDAILNIIDGTNLERNLYLSTQLIEIGLPVVMAVNMMDLVKKNGDTIDVKKMAEELGCEVVEISALQGKGCMEAAEKAIAAAKAKRTVHLPSVFTGSVEHAIAHIEETIAPKVEDRFLRWYAIKVFERDCAFLIQIPLYKSVPSPFRASIRLANHPGSKLYFDRIRDIRRVRSISIKVKGILFAFLNSFYMNRKMSLLLRICCDEFVLIINFLVSS